MVERVCVITDCDDESHEGSAWCEAHHLLCRAKPGDVVKKLLAERDEVRRSLRSAEFVEDPSDGGFRDAPYLRLDGDAVLALRRAVSRETEQT